MPGLSPDLHQRVCAALIASGYCDSADTLRAVCVDARLAPWRDDLPDIATTRRRRAEAVVAALWEQRAESGENALALLLHTLSERFEGDARRRTFAELAVECEAVASTPETGVSLAYAHLYTPPTSPTDFIGHGTERGELDKWWERKESAYLEVINTLARLTDLLDRWIKGLVRSYFDEGYDFSLESQEAIYTEYQRLRSQIRHFAIVGDYLFSISAVSALSALNKQLEQKDQVETLQSMIDFLAVEHNAAQECLEIMKGEARLDLGV